MPTVQAVNKSPRISPCAWQWLLLLLCTIAPALQAQQAAAPSFAQQVQDFADATSRAAAGAARIEVSVGQLDPRLRLAPCTKVEPYLPNGTRLWGKAHIGVRCLAGTTLWNVYLPVTVKVYGRALAATTALPAGTTLGPADLAEAEVDLAAEGGSVFAAAQSQNLVGRTLLRPVSAGQALRSNALKQRLWFTAGDTVRITATGSGFAVESSGEALSNGFEGQSARVRTAGGRVISATPVGEREVELGL